MKSLNRRLNQLQIKQIYLSNMSTFCYLIGDDTTKTCALIDPAFQTNMLQKEIEKKGFTLTHVINTHNHPDHTSGNASLIASTGAKLYIHSIDGKKLGKFLHGAFSRIFGGKGSPEADVLLEDGDDINIGEITIKVIHTPGHTPGSICLYIKGNVFTGDTLFVESMGRTDLPGGSHKTLIESIHEKIYSLPDETIIWPGHDYGPSPKSTVGQEKKNNPFTMA
ncbi:MAG: MBL fold metallo-hydrolase [Desulfobacterales bacterium]|jgi:hydroxyacylglutathione hydrolase|nr:MBL fold metallo-hydrolase [Desulfobacteraceae bacterium]MBT4363980.1 MBL fold metallo-hydrolase [Desulfobacteraceae bacterium]MBT7086226.1 MBL fold metallo-hydrolase [Desulfobacterales bacterium]MBT7696936.1 MBL fold metallo-hydrolase [Desulfobacterales bacterium]